jgi:hypothetical protein
MNMDFILAIQPNIKDFEKIYEMIYSTCCKYYNNKIDLVRFKRLFDNIENLYSLFNPAILEEIKNCYIAYIESMLILYLENKHPKYVKRLSSGTFNSVYQISVKINEKYINCALRLSKNEICNINFEKIKKQNWYDNLLYYNDISLKKYLKFYPNILDSSLYYHYVNSKSKSKIYYTHWSISEIYSPLYNIDKYRNKYIHTVKKLLKIFETNGLLYFDWKINNFMVNNKDELILVDTDFENIYSLMAVCSTHRLTPDPSDNLNKMESILKMAQSNLLMYISAYLSLIAITKSKNLSEYYSSFKFINKFDKMINNESTINSVISLVTENEYNKLPIVKSDIRKILNMIKNKINNF